MYFFFWNLKLMGIYTNMFDYQQKKMILSKEKYNIQNN